MKCNRLFVITFFVQVILMVSRQGCLYYDKPEEINSIDILIEQNQEKEKSISVMVSCFETPQNNFKKYKPLVEYISEETKTEIQLLQKAIIILPQLCIFTMKLPDISINYLSDHESPGITSKQWDEIYKSLQQKLSSYDYYLEIFDPYEYEKPVAGSLADDLAGIYKDIKEGLSDWENVNSRDRLNIIWEWKFSFNSHWGEHATGAFRALYSLLFRHIKDKYGDYIGIRDENQSKKK